MNKRFYLYGLFYEDEEDNICFYIGSGTGHRCKDHFKPSELNKDAWKANKINKLKRNGKDPFPIVLKNRLTEKEARSIEDSLLKRDSVWEEITNTYRSSCGAPSGEEHPMKNEKVAKKCSETKIKKYNNGEIEPLRGEECSSSKVSKEEVEEIKWLTENTNILYSDISNKYNLNPSQISRIKKGKRWAHIKSTKKPEWYSRKLEDKRRGETNSGSVTNLEASEIKWIYKNEDTTQENLANFYDCSRQCISKIVTEITYSNIGCSKPDWYSEIESFEQHEEEQEETNEQNQST